MMPVLEDMGSATLNVVISAEERRAANKMAKEQNVAENKRSRKSEGKSPAVTKNSEVNGKGKSPAITKNGHGKGDSDKKAPTKNFPMFDKVKPKAGGSKSSPLPPTPKVEEFKEEKMETDDVKVEEEKEVEKENHEDEAKKKVPAKRRKAANKKPIKEDLYEENGRDEEDEDYEEASSESSKKRKAKSTPVAANGNSKKAKREPKAEVCQTCAKPLDSSDLVFYEGHPDGFVDEITAIFDPKLELKDHDANFDEKPQHRVTQFTFFDQQNHLVSFHDGIVDSGGEIFFSGYMKLVTDDGPLAEGGIPVGNVGPVIEWWIGGLEGDENHIIGKT